MQQSKVFLEQSPQDTLNIIESLRFYRDNAIKPKFSPIRRPVVQRFGLA